MSSDTLSTAAISPNFLVTLRMRTNGLTVGSRQGRVSAASFCFVAMTGRRPGKVRTGPKPRPKIALLAGFDALPGFGQELIIIGRMRLEVEELGRHLGRRIDRRVVLDFVVDELERRLVAR